MKPSFLMKRIIGTEYLLAAILTAILFISFANFDWWWLFILFPVVDISAFGYLQNNRAGALMYNVGHSLIGPVVFLAIYIFGGPDWALFVAMVWLFHIFVDRALGYGMKHVEGFGHTHLGKVGKAKRASSSKKKTNKKK
ncbi:MAG TPA: DUF4260 family protein [Candidatus Saccharimonadales bacterium]